MHSIARAIRPYLPFALLFFMVFLVSTPSLGRRDIDGHDSAHHLMTGLFFRDLFLDLPIDHLISYTFKYYAQYPALGFLFWPPFFHFVEGLFFLLGGSDFLAARLCIFAFGIVFAIFMFLSLKIWMGKFSALFVSLLIITTLAIARLFNMIMLEIPVMAMAFLTIYFYKRTMLKEARPGWVATVGFIFAGTAAIYTKQTIIFLFPALAVDFIVNHREKFKHRIIWISVACIVLLCVPLAIFTIRYGSANWAQSFGADTNLIYNYSGPGRWSVASWLYYPKQLPKMLSPVLIALGLACFIYGFFRKSFIRRNALWIAWIVIWYLLFSLFHNKASRFAVLWLPPWVILAVSFVRALVHEFRRPKRFIYIIFLIPFLINAREVMRMDVRGFSGMESVVARLFCRGSPGNIAYFGQFRQFFVPYIRVHDNVRQVYTLQGDDIITVASDLEAACYDYKVNIVIIEAMSDDLCPFPEVLNRLESGDPFEFLYKEDLRLTRFQRYLLVYRYTGKVRRKMKPVPLVTNLVGKRVIYVPIEK